MVMNNEDTEDVVVTRRAKRFTEHEDDEFFEKNCLKLHHDLTESFRNERGELPVLIKILRVSSKRTNVVGQCAMPPGPKFKKRGGARKHPRKKGPKYLGS
jgi:hypothetical protein